MAARSTDAEGAPIFGHFHQNCVREVELSEDRRVASGTFSSTTIPIAFSGAPIRNGQKFSLNVLKRGSFVSPCSHYSKV